MSLLSSFLEQITEFLVDLMVIYPDDNDLKNATDMLMHMKKSNPKLLVIIWNKYVVEKYEQKIMEGDINYFLDKNYKEDIVDIQQNGIRILEAIDRFRQRIKGLSESNKDKSIKYIQNITKLSSSIIHS